VISWPSDYNTAFTLAHPVERQGVGLHSGATCRVRLLPSNREGFWVAWQGASRDSLQRLSPHQVVDTRLCTCLQIGPRRLATVEHLLAALAGTGVSHAELWLEGEEIPLLDGSALPWVEAIAEAGLRALGPREPLLLAETLTRHLGETFAVAIPAPAPRLAAAVEYPQAAIGRQVFSLALTPESFVAELAPARTFGFLDQVEQLRASGLIQGGALDNALVCDGDRWLNPPLRYPDEPVRHKLLDLLGDLALVGIPQAQVFAYRGSHGLHTTLAAALKAAPERAHSLATPCP
jgi:UDP-3-O-[3-hydroxymyristoyl] N-acetylglucosamine deacetylase